MDKMEDFSFKGDTEDLSERQLKFLVKVFVDRGFNNGTVGIEKVGEVDDNYVANVKLITIESRRKVLKIIAKIASKNKTLREGMLATESVFNNEHFMYTKVLPKFAELQKAADVPIYQRYRFPECYGTLMEKYEEMILLEDLKDSNFITFDKHKPLSTDCVKLVFKDFAAFHAMSYALRNQEPETFSYLKSKLVNTWNKMKVNEYAEHFFHTLEADILEIVEDDKYKSVLKGLMHNLLDYTETNAAIHSVSKYSVIEHGDAWTNNIMFQIMDGKAKKCCLIDYQLSKESSPVTDIHYMVFACTDYYTRKLHYHDWMNYYYSELEKALSYYDLEKSVYPRDQFEADQKRLSKQSIGISVLLSTFLVRDAAATAIMKDTFAEEGSQSNEEKIEASKMASLDQNTFEKFNIRVKGIIDSFLELGNL